MEEEVGTGAGGGGGVAAPAGVGAAGTALAAEADAAFALDAAAALTGAISSGVMPSSASIAGSNVLTSAVSALESVLLTTVFSSFTLQMLSMFQLRRSLISSMILDLPAMRACSSFASTCRASTSSNSASSSASPHWMPFKRALMMFRRDWSPALCWMNSCTSLSSFSSLSSLLRCFIRNHESLSILGCRSLSSSESSMLSHLL
mmetsp:Transcript_25785/g.57100  ORF Transcript_25785/g.57100 Transcript_25785/m.57100 type:complete len:204 (+) Transcript_25785:920-1531(+)